LSPDVQRKKVDFESLNEDYEMDDNINQLFDSVSKGVPKLKDSNSGVLLRLRTCSPKK
jgi:hypothetical protein